MAVKFIGQIATVEDGATCLQLTIDHLEPLGRTILITFTETHGLAVVLEVVSHSRQLAVLCSGTGTCVIESMACLSTIVHQ